MAMTRNDICIEQNRFYQGSTLANTQRGCTVWMPDDYDNNIWQGHRLAPNPSIATDNVTSWQLKGHWRANFYAGTYIPAVYSATYGKPDELTYSGAWSDSAIYAANFGVTNELWHAVYRASNDRSVSVTVPADTTNFYMYCPFNSALNPNVTISVEVVSGSAILVKPTFTMADFGTWTGYQNAGYALIAANAGGSVIKFTRGEEAGTLYIAGWIAVNKNLPSHPDTGVYDPSSLVDLFKTGGQADGPIYLKFGAGGTPFFWGAYHWSATQTLINEAETYTYDTNKAYNQTMTFTDNTWIRQVASCFRRSLSGDMQTKNGANDAHTTGTHSSIYSFYPYGLEIALTHTFNAQAATDDLRLAGGAGYTGGYAGKWNLPSQFTTARLLGQEKTVSIGPPYETAPSTGRLAITAKGVAIEAFSSALNAKAVFTCQNNVYNAAGTAADSSIWILVSTVEAGSCPKVYKNMCDETIDLAEGDIATGTHLRQMFSWKDRNVYNINPKIKLNNFGE